MYEMWLESLMQMGGSLEHLRKSEISEAGCETHAIIMSGGDRRSGIRRILRCKESYGGFP